MTDTELMERKKTTRPSAELQPFIGIEEISAIEENSYRIIEALRKNIFSPENKKVLELRFTISQAADMVFRTPQAIRDAEKKYPDFPQPSAEQSGRRRLYKLEDINAMRDHFGTRLTRTETDETVVMAVANFKGGVGKSTITCHVAQYFALRGYRVCVVDCDPQGSTTVLFGLNPDLDIDDEDTLYPFLTDNEIEDISYAVRETYFDGIWTVSANLGLYDAEYELAGMVAGNQPEALNRLKMGIDSVKEHFDIVIIDPPPALGMISLSVLRAANALLVPVPPSTVDFASTAHFFTMLKDSLILLEKFGLPAGYKFLKVLGSKVDEGKSAHPEIITMMKSVYGNTMLDGLLKDSAEIDNATLRLMTVYELNNPITSRETHNRCKAYLNAVCREIELEVRKTWPGHREALRKDGLI